MTEKSFQSKLSMAQLRTEVLQNKLDAGSICEKYKIKPYTLQQKLYSAAVNANNKAEAWDFLMDIPIEVSNVIEKKKKLTLPSGLCSNLGIDGKFEVTRNEKTGVIKLTPVK